MSEKFPLGEPVFPLFGPSGQYAILVDDGMNFEPEKRDKLYRKFYKAALKDARKILSNKPRYLQEEAASVLAHFATEMVLAPDRKTEKEILRRYQQVGLRIHKMHRL